VKTYDALLEKYSRQATHYDRRWNLRWGEATLRAAVEAVPWNELGRVLDVGCGTGVLEHTVHPRLRPSLSLIGVDISLPMLQLARQKLNGATRINWTNSPAEHLPFAGGAFDALICNNSFHYYRQPLPVLQEFRRVLRTDGWLILVDWCNDFISCKLGQWGLRLAHHTYIHRYALSRIYGLKEFERLLKTSGFRVQSAQRIPLDLGWGIMLFRARA
jgi:ubiquinone/menaquinone biosynthesis C-methylase UbiE